MTTRQRIKLKLVVSARKSKPKDRDAFKRAALELFDALDDAVLIAELDRIEAQQMGITKLIGEAWKEYCENP